MRKVIVSPAAVEDLGTIWSYVAERDLAAADRLVDRIEQALGRLAEFPGMGHRRVDVTDRAYRFLVVRPYVVAYRHDETTLTVVRVLHGRRDVRRAMI